MRKPKETVKEQTEWYVDALVHHKKYAVALGFPNTYYCGMSNLGMQHIYRAINTRVDTQCERFFWDITASAITTVETGRKICNFSVIALSISFEMDYFNVIKLLDTAHISLYAAARHEYEPILIGGGACLSNNPEPIAELFDAIVIGEGEDVIHSILDVVHVMRDSGAERKEILTALAKVQGVYVPCIKNTVQRIFVSDINERIPAHSAIVAADTEFAQMFLVEIARGCGRGCRFCMAGYSTRPQREYNLDKLIEVLDIARRNNWKVGLVGCAVSDYPHIDELCNYLLKHKMAFSVASLRADSVSDKLLYALATMGHRTVTFAPEAGSDKVRTIINKSITEKQLLEAVQRSARAGIANVRLYFMLGLPGETTDDVAAIVQMAVQARDALRRCSHNGRITLSVNPFVPKPNTPFERLPFAERTVREHYKLLEQLVRRIAGVNVKFEDYRESVVQALIARAGRELTPILIEAARMGGYRKLKQVMKDNGMTFDNYFCGFELNDNLPWQHIEVIDRNYLDSEYSNALNEKMTPRCTQGCKRCGVCT